jgi:hypothetical protein
VESRILIVVPARNTVKAVQSLKRPYIEDMRAFIGFNCLMGLL